jgi:hypothetical protein
VLPRAEPSVVLLTARYASLAREVYLLGHEVVILGRPAAPAVLYEGMTVLPAPVLVEGLVTAVREAHLRLRVAVT